MGRVTGGEQEGSTEEKKWDKMWWRVVQLKQRVTRWRAAALRRRLAAVIDVGAATRVVPPGFLAVYAGPERRRFVIPTRFLNFPVFSVLLSLAEEEFGFSAEGGLVLPCDADFFGRVLELLFRDEARFKNLGIEGFMELSGLAGPGASSFSSSCRDESQFSYSAGLWKTSA